jgi:hypothetical protein
MEALEIGSRRSSGAIRQCRHKRKVSYISILCLGGGRRIVWRGRLGHLAKVGVEGSNPFARSRIANDW